MFRSKVRITPDHLRATPDKELFQAMINKERQYRHAQALWSGCFHASLFVVPAASLTTTILAALKAQAVATTIVSASVTFMVAIAAAGRFREKWVNARTSRGGVESLIVDLRDPAADRSVIRASFKQIIKDEDSAVIRDGSQAT